MSELCHAIFFVLLYKSDYIFVTHSGLGMPKEKYDPPDSRRMYTIMSSEEANSGKKSIWDGLEITGMCLELNPLINMGSDQLTSDHSCNGSETY